MLSSRSRHLQFILKLRLIIGTRNSIQPSLHTPIKGIFLQILHILIRLPILPIILMTATPQHLHLHPPHLLPHRRPCHPLPSTQHLRHRPITRKPLPRTRRSCPPSITALHRRPPRAALTLSSASPAAAPLVAPGTPSGHPGVVDFPTEVWVSSAVSGGGRGGS